MDNILYGDAIMEEEVQDIGSTESTINPEYWAFIAVNKAIEALGSSEELKTSMLKFIALVNVAESIAKGQERIGEDYERELDEFTKNNNKYTQEGLSIDAKQMLLCTKKMELISKAIGSNMAIREPMRLEKK